MNSKIAESIKLATEPVALLWSDTLPDDAVMFEKGKWGCVISLVAAAAKGKTVAFDRETCGCPGGGVGLGFGDMYKSFPGGTEGFCRFLSDGNEFTPTGPIIAQAMANAGARKEFCDHFLHGERYRKNPELVKGFLDLLGVMDIDAKYVIFKPLSTLAPSETPVSVTLFVTPDQLSACVVFANYDQARSDAAIIPHAAACQITGLLSYHEAASDSPRCLVGMTDITARKYLKSSIGDGHLSFTIPWERFREMEYNVSGSFLEGDTWNSLIS
jgi:COG2043 family uncharacterized protein